MTETARLVIAVDSSSAKKATADLDALSKTGKNSERVANSTGKAWGTALGLIGSAAVIGGFSAVIKATIEAEKVQAQLAARIKSTGGAAGLALDELNEMASGLQRLTTYDDEAIGSAQALMLTFTKIGKEVFPDALEATLDMATALGTDLNSAALQVGKALNDPVQGITALTRAGVQFTDAQKDVIKELVETGRVAEAQRIILAELETQMGGSARAARDTLGGAFQALKNAAGDLMEGPNGSLNGVTGAVNDLTDTLSAPETKQAFSDMIGWLAGVASQAIQTITALREYYGEAGKRSSTVLRNQINDQEGKVFAQERMLKRTANVPFLGAADAKLLADERAELQRLESALASAEARERTQNRPKVLLSDSGAMPESMFRNPAKTATATADPVAIKGTRERTAAVKELTAAEKEWLEFQEDMNVVQEAWNEAEVEAIQRTQDKADAVEESQQAIEGMIDDMEFELSLIGMTNIEREKEIALRYAGIDATEEQKNKIGELTEAMAKAQEQQAFWLDTQHAASDALVDFASGSASAKEAFGDFADDLYKRALQWVSDQAMQALFGGLSGMGSGSTGSGVESGLGGLLSLFTGGDWGFKNGGAFSNGNVMAFANGGVVGGPTNFAMSGGRTGLMGEAGPEAIMPLSRGRDGKLGVAGGGGSRTTNITINVPKSYSFRTAANVAQETAAYQARQTQRSS